MEGSQAVIVLLETLYHNIIKGMVGYVGLLLALAEGFGLRSRLFLIFREKSLFVQYLPFYDFFFFNFFLLFYKKIGYVKKKH